MTVHLIAADVARAALKAHAEGRLGFQRHPGDLCRYRYYDGAVCGIGAALPDTIDFQASTGAMYPTIVNELPVSELVDYGVITTDNLGALKRIQSAHDNVSLPAFGEAEFLSVCNSIAGAA